MKSCVQASANLAISSRQSKRTQKFNSEQVIAWGNALRECKAPQSIVRNHGIDSPFATAKSLTRDLEPLLPGTRRRGGVVDFGEVDLNGALVRRSDWVIWVIGALWATDEMLPVRADGISGLDVDDGARGGSRNVACMICVGDGANRLDR